MSTDVVSGIYHVHAPSQPIGDPNPLQIYQPFRHLAQAFAQKMDQFSPKNWQSQPSQSPNKCSAVAFNSMALLQTSNKPGPVMEYNGESFETFGL